MRDSKSGRAEEGTSQSRRDQPVVAGAEGVEGNEERAMGSAMASVMIWCGDQKTALRCEGRLTHNR